MCAAKLQNGDSLRTQSQTEKKAHNGASSEYDGMTVDQLRKQLKHRSLRQQGSKSDLIKRLVDSDFDSDGSPSKVTMSTKSPPKRGRSRSRSASRSRTAAASSGVVDESHDAHAANGGSTLTQRSAAANGEVDAALDTSARANRSSSRGKSLLDAGVLRQRTLSGQQHAAKQREEEIDAILDKMTIWRTPFQTLTYFVRELGYYAVGLAYSIRYWRALLSRRNIAICLTLVLLATVVQLGGYRERLLWYGYWCGLGILSSIGLGTGLHTFLLYLGPFIARVTIAAFECNTIDFKEPPFPYEIVCPPTGSGAATSNDTKSVVDSAASGITLLMLMSKVRWEAIAWGAGTAIGELPPYFISRSARLAGTASEAEFEEEIRSLESRVQQRIATRFERAKFFVYNFIRRVGFWGILVCASIPNPLFDLAGITCGHFLIPFGTFFGATLIGKSVIKMHIQQLFVIVAFSAHHVDTVLDWAARIPFVGVRIREPVARYLDEQRAKFHGKVVPEETWLQTAITWCVYAIIAYFVLSIINSLAKANYRRQLEAQSADEESDKDKSPAAKKRAERKAERATAASASPSHSAGQSRSRPSRNRIDS